MTQTPHMPPIDPPEPFDEAERELARALRSLPVGSPPPELDARILGAARRAVQLSKPRRKVGWIRSLSIGTAASALLAIGLFLKMQGPNEHAPVAADAELADKSQAPATAAAPAAAAEADRARGQPADNFAASKVLSPPPPPPPPLPHTPMVVEESAPVSEPEAMTVPAPTPPPPAPAPMPIGASPQTVERDELPASKAPAAFPATVAPAQKPADLANNAPPPPPEADGLQQPSKTQPTLPMAANQQAAQAKSAALRDEIQTESAAPQAGIISSTIADRADLSKDSERKQDDLKSAPAAGSAAPPSGSVGSDAAIADKKSRSLDTITVTGARITREDPDSRLPAVSTDSDLPSDLWIERIRTRVKFQDVIGARQSLKRFHSHYPDVDIPDDLQPLLK